MSYDVLVYGPLFTDLIYTGLPAMPELGTELFAEDFTIALGGSAIVAAGLQRLGARVGLIADLGNDLMSRVAKDLLDELHIDRRLIREHPYPLPQITTALSFPHDRAFITRFRKPDTPVDLAALLKAHPARHLHLASFLGAMQLPQACEIAHAAGLTVSFDPGWDEHALRDPVLHRIAACVDVFMPSESELCYIAQIEDTESALVQTLTSMQGGMIVMKQGKTGALAYSTTQRLHVPALSVTPVDTTGAGDSFDAGFLFRYAQGAPLNECLRYGAVCGALSTTRAGGASAAPSNEEVKQWLSKLPS